MSHAAVITPPLWQDPDFASLKHHLIESTGLAYYADKDQDLALRISPRLSELALEGCGAYLALLKNREAGEAERHLLISQLTIGETYFFRFTEQFDALRDVVIPALLERNQATRTLRIWSAGCAIGAEPYSIAILLQEHFADRLEGWDVRILGTDINATFLSRAERGEFDERALRSTPDEVKRKWFSPAGRSWIINPLAKDWVSFQYHNLVEHPYPSIVHGIVALDLILCRNVLIYFDWDVIQHIIGRFHDCLVDEGWLIVGHAESNTEVFRPYRTVNVPGATLYQKSGPLPAGTPRVTLASPAPMEWPPAAGLQPVWSPLTLPTLPDAPANRPVPESDVPGPTGLAMIRRLAAEGKWQEAQSACTALLEDDRLNAAAHFYQGLILEQRRHLQAAEAAFRRAVYLNRSFILAHYHLALLQRKNGHRDVARQSLRNVQTLLSAMKKDDPIAEADGLTADDLAQLTDMHLELLRMNSHSATVYAEPFAPDQDLIDEVYRRRARQLAERRATATSVRTIPVLVFGLGTERYAIELSELAEVLPYAGCSAVPGAPAGLIGVINVRGEIRSVADLRWIVGLEPGDASGTGYVLMLRQQGHAVGFKVDTIDHVREIDPVLAAPGAAAPVPGARCVKALTPDAVIVVDTGAALAQLSPLFA